MRLTRRKFIGSMAVLGAGAAMPAWAQESVFDMFSTGRVLRETDKEGNTAAAAASIATNEPILSFDTLHNLQLAISQYEPFVAAGGWEEIPQQAYQLILGNSSPAVVQLKRRLISSGDMPLVEFASDVFDAETDRGVRTFQARHGLVVTGQIDDRRAHCTILVTVVVRTGISSSLIAFHGPNRTRLCATRRRSRRTGSGRR